MAYFKHLLTIAASLAVAPMVSSALADDLFNNGDGYFMSDTDFTAADPNENFVLRGSVGVTSITANEQVFRAPAGDDLLSLLVWQSTAPIASMDAKVRFPGEWTLRGHIDAAISGDSVVTDYDWTGFAPSLSMNDWDQRSISPNTNLDWYLNGSIAVGRDLPVNDALMVNVNGGFKYTDVKWTARGGSFIYSDNTNGFRGTIGNFGDGPVGDYRMQLPTLFAGVDTTVRDGPWSLEVNGKAGIAFNATDTDHHFLRNIVFVDHLDYSQFLSADANLGYDFSDNLGVFLAASYEKLKSGHGDTDVYDHDAGTTTHEAGAAGATLDVLSIKAGLKGNF
jgi:plasminogen activator